MLGIRAYPKQGAADLWTSLGQTGMHEASEISTGRDRRRGFRDRVRDSRMTTARKKRLIEAVEDYLSGLRRIRASGGATGERSSYGPLAELLNAVGATLKPKVFCVGELAD